ncbi:MAG: hypothetical protein F2808_05450 [Actinobacteria bacterium]|uniref:Unannotated protein n=1 Tax=freshwater metagenome TaxID=449393 RepID=A0A6J7GHU1_9ZZZZ|nr:hypothetical protein [Actinomycetota bacterium]
MKRTELEMAIVIATHIIAQPRILIIGSQAILGSFDESELPARATASQEIDMAPLQDDVAESLATRIDALAGEWSAFDAEHGIYIQGVSVRTAFLPSGWEERLIEVRPTVNPKVLGLCLEAHDLCAAKMGRNDSKDREFVSALVEAGLVSPERVSQRLREISDPRFSHQAKHISLQFLSSLS